MMDDPERHRVGPRSANLPSVLAASIVSMFDVAQSPRCIFCLETDRPFNAPEHVLPEGLGNTELILPPGVVCDGCNNGPLSVCDQAFLDFTPVALMRVTQGIRTKKGGFASVKLGNATVRQLAPDNVGVWVHSAKALTKTPAGFNAKFLGRRMTPRYIAEVTRIFFKAVLEFTYVDVGTAEALAPKYNEVRRIALGAPYNGYLILGRSVQPHGDVRFTYQPVQLNGRDTVLAAMDVYGVTMATDLLVRDASMLRSAPDLAVVVRF
jgi:hypothetical protein